MTDDLANSPLPADTVGLLEGLTSTRAIRRYRDEPVPPEALRAMLFAATRAPSGSNRQPFRFIVLTDGPKAKQAKELIATGARKVWSGKRTNDGYDSGSGTVENSPKARMAASMQRYTDEFERVPVLVLPCLVRYRDPTPFEGASVFPAVQNLLLACRAVGLGASIQTLPIWWIPSARKILGLPRSMNPVCIIPIGWARGKYGPTQRRPIGEVVHVDRYGNQPFVGWEKPKSG